jgi:hypothetical protein
MTIVRQGTRENSLTAFNPLDLLPPDQIDRLLAQRSALQGRAIPPALSRPQAMVREALRMGGCPHRALAQIADDDLAVARQLLADEMEGRRE